MKSRDIILGIGGIAFLVLAVFLALLLGDRFNVTTCGCPKVISQNFVYLFIILAVIFVSCLLYYLFSLKLDTQKCIINRNTEILYAILDKDEKLVLDKLIKSRGELMQSELSNIPNFDKIKAHRVIKKLIEKKIIDVKKDGKTNKIMLKSELKQELA